MYGNYYNDFGSGNFNNNTLNFQQRKTNKIFVNGIDEVRNIMSQPNSDVIYLDTNLPKLYCKTVDSMGRSVIDVYNIVKDGESVDKTVEERLTKLEDKIFGVGVPDTPTE